MSPSAAKVNSAAATGLHKASHSAVMAIGFKSFDTEDTEDTEERQIKSNRQDAKTAKKYRANGLTSTPTSARPSIVERHSACAHGCVGRRVRRHFDP